MSSVDSQDTPLNELTHEQKLVIHEEESALSKVMKSLSAELNQSEQEVSLDEDLIALRDQIQEAREEDKAALLDHMNRLAALQHTREVREVEATDEELFSSPYFARITYQEEDENGEDTGRTCEIFIGKRSFFSQDGRVKVVDWRSSPISKLYYTFREGDFFYEEMGSRVVAGVLDKRRTLTIREATLERVQFGKKSDQTLRLTSLGWSQEARSIARLEGGERSADRPSTSQLGYGGRSGGLPEITALIDPEQFSLITGDRSGVVIIQGGAGTGKTTIALHRIAYLYYQNPERFDPRRCLIIAPGKALKNYVERSLPSLDLVGVRVHTFGEWALQTLKQLNPDLKDYELHEETPPGSSRLKRHPLLLKHLANRVTLEGRSLDLSVERVGGPLLLGEWVKRRALPLVDRIKKTLEIAEKNSLSLEAQRVFQDALRDASDVVSSWVDALSDIDGLRKTFQDHGAKIYEWELKQLKETVWEQSLSQESFDDLDAEYQVGVDQLALDTSAFRQRLDTEDCAILLYLTQHKFGHLEGASGRISYAHVTVDEAQDLSPIALRVLCDVTPPQAPVTLAGDTAQRVVFNNGFNSWRDALKFLPKGSQLLPPLTVSYRSTRQVMVLARHLLGELAHQWESRDFRDGAPVGFLHFEERGEGIAFLGEALKRLMTTEPNASVALVTRELEQARHYYDLLQQVSVPSLRLIAHQDFPFTAGIDLTDVKQIKGLEYDYIVALDIDERTYPNREDARHLLHVVATRAAHQLWLMCLGEVQPSPLLPSLLIEQGELDVEFSDHIK